MKTSKIVLPTILLLASLLVSACAAAGSPTASNSSPTAAGSATAVISSVTVTDSLQVSGTLGADQLAALAWGTSGVIDTVSATVGQAVKAGDTLAALKTESVPADIITAQANLVAAQRNLQTLFDSQATQSAAQAAVASAEQSVNTAQNALNSANSARAPEAQLNSLLTNIDSAQKAVLRAAGKAKKYDRTKGAILATTADLAVVTAKLNLSTQIATYNWYTGAPDSTALDLLRANLAVAQASLADAQRSWQIVQSGPDPLAVQAAQASVDAALASVDKMSIIAPFDGRVLSIQASPNISVNPGDAALELVNPATLKVDTLVDETAVSSIAVGDPAQVSMDMLPGVLLKGKVTIVGSIGTTVNGLVMYKVTIGLDPTTQPVRFGATANATIITSQPRAMLAAPAAAIHSDAKGEFISVVNRDGSTTRVAVTSGSPSGSLMTFSTTSASVKAGEQVLLGAGN